MPNPRRSRQIVRATRLAFCEALESRILLAGDSVLFDSLVSLQASTSGSRAEGLVADADGNLYGTTTTGGTKNYGTVFKIAAGTHEFSTLASFKGGIEGISPTGNLFFDAGTGLLYGTTVGGGTSHKGTLFDINVNASTPTITTLASFDGVDGSYPLGGLVADASGNLYGTATGSSTRGYASTVWTVAASDSTHTITALATFKSTDLLSGQLATTPDGLLFTDAEHHIFGTTRNGGTHNIGSIFRVNTDHSVTTLASFSSTQGAHPTASLIYNQSNGAFIGTALNGGSKGYGTLFELSSSSSLTVLANFDLTHGAHPIGRLVIDSDGNIFGVTTSGGTKNYGTVFERLAGTANTISTVYQLSRQRDGLNPTTLVVNAGHFYVATYGGGAHNAGTIFELDNVPVVFTPPSLPPIIITPSYKIVIDQQPTTALAPNQPFLLQIHVGDTHSIILVNAAATLSILSGPAGSALAGSQTATIALGTATFSDVSLTLPGLYTLQISAPSLVSAVTNTIAVEFVNS